MLLEKVAAQGSRVDTLRAFRDEVARSIDVCDSARDKAQLGRLLVDVLAQIDEIAPPVVKPKGTPLDELKERRAARKPVAASSRRTKSAAK